MTNNWNWLNYCHYNPSSKYSMLSVTCPVSVSASMVSRSISFKRHWVSMSNPSEWIEFWTLSHSKLFADEETREHSESVTAPVWKGLAFWITKVSSGNVDVTLIYMRILSLQTKLKFTTPRNHLTLSEDAFLVNCNCVCLTQNCISDIPWTGWRIVYQSFMFPFQV